MPRHNSLKFVFVEAVLFVGLFALVGHLSVNFWERYIIQSEITNMKCSLHSMKETISNIGKAYDNLHKELKELIGIAERKSLSENSEKKIKPNNFNRRKLHDLQVQAMVTELNDIKVGKNTNNKATEFNPGNKRTSNKNETTITRYPPKSTGTDSIKYNMQDECTQGKIHKCYKGYKYCAYPCKHWKF